MAENIERILEEQKLENQTEIRRPTTEIVDLQKNREITVPRDVKTWMERVESDPDTNNQTVSTTNDNDSILQPIATTVVKITLPTDKKTFVGGFSRPVNDAWRWFSEFLLRIIKKNQGNVKFKEE
ncbi:MAG: hypothetical protein WC895_03715 [Candidatus Shapirobacteria bacterium]|jgi:hypothetical protein